jgi:hypothetical protein
MQRGHDEEFHEVLERLRVLGLGKGVRALERILRIGLLMITVPSHDGR